METCTLFDSTDATQISLSGVQAAESPLLGHASSRTKPSLLGGSFYFGFASRAENCPTTSYSSEQVTHVGCHGRKFQDSNGTAVSISFDKDFRNFQSEISSQVSSHQASTSLPYNANDLQQDREWIQRSEVNDTTDTGTFLTKMQNNCDAQCIRTSYGVDSRGDLPLYTVITPVKAASNEHTKPKLKSQLAKLIAEVLFASGCQQQQTAPSSDSLQPFQSETLITSYDVGKQLGLLKSKKNLRKNIACAVPPIAFNSSLDPFSLAGVTQDEPLAAIPATNVLDHVVEVPLDDSRQPHHTGTDLGSRAGPQLSRRDPLGDEQRELQASISQSGSPVAHVASDPGTAEDYYRSAYLRKFLKEPVAEPGLTQQIISQLSPEPTRIDECCDVQLSPILTRKFDTLIRGTFDNTNDLCDGQRIRHGSNLDLDLDVIASSCHAGAPNNFGPYSSWTVGDLERDVAEQESQSDIESTQFDLELGSNPKRSEKGECQDTDPGVTGCASNNAGREVVINSNVCLSISATNTEREVPNGSRSVVSLPPRVTERKDPPSHHVTFDMSLSPLFEDDFLYDSAAAVVSEEVVVAKKYLAYDPHVGGSPTRHGSLSTASVSSASAAFCRNTEPLNISFGLDVSRQNSSCSIDQQEQSAHVVTRTTKLGLDLPSQSCHAESAGKVEFAVQEHLDFSLPVPTYTQATIKSATHTINRGCNPPLGECGQGSDPVQVGGIEVEGQTPLGTSPNSSMPRMATKSASLMSAVSDPLNLKQNLVKPNMTGVTSFLTKNHSSEILKSNSNTNFEINPNSLDFKPEADVLIRRHGRSSRLFFGTKKFTERPKRQSPGSCYFTEAQESKLRKVGFKPPFRHALPHSKEQLTTSAGSKDVSVFAVPQSPSNPSVIVTNPVTPTVSLPIPLATSTPCKEKLPLANVRHLPRSTALQKQGDRSGSGSFQDIIADTDDLGGCKGGLASGEENKFKKKIVSIKPTNLIPSFVTKLKAFSYKRKPEWSYPESDNGDFSDASSVVSEDEDPFSVRNQAPAPPLFPDNIRSKPSSVAGKKWVTQPKSDDSFKPLNTFSIGQKNYVKKRALSPNEPIFKKPSLVLVSRKKQAKKSSPTSSASKKLMPPESGPAQHTSSPACDVSGILSCESHLCRDQEASAPKGGHPPLSGSRRGISNYLDGEVLSFFSGQESLSRLSAARELCITLLYRDGSSQVREQPVGSGVGRAGRPHALNTGSQVEAFALRAVWDEPQLDKPGAAPASSSAPLPPALPLSDALTRRVSVFRVPVGSSFDDEWARRVVGVVMASKARKVCFDAQEAVTYLVERLSFSYTVVVRSWLLLDPKVGVWLMDADHPPVTFRDTLGALQRHSGQTSLAGSSNSSSPLDDSAPTLSGDLQQLSASMSTLHGQLTAAGLWPLFFFLEMRMVPSLAVMELRGIRVNREVLARNAKVLKESTSGLERECQRVSGSFVNVSSPSQLRVLLYDTLKLDRGVPVPYTPAGHKSTSEAALSLLVGRHPLPGLLLRHRCLNKLRNTFVDGIKACVNAGYIAPAWEQTAAATGRIQCRSPNLQALPKNPVAVGPDMELPNTLAPDTLCDAVSTGGKRRDNNTTGNCVSPTALLGLSSQLQHQNKTEGNTTTNCTTTTPDTVSIIARAALCSEEGCVLVAADFQQMELRLLAHFSQDPVLLEAFRVHGDVFEELAAKWLGRVTPEARDSTKRLVYAAMYGAGKDKLAQVLRLTMLEATQALHSFNEIVPGISSYRQGVLEQCRARGFLTTLFRRRRYFPLINAEVARIRSHAQRQAINFVIQGSAADICKAAQVRTEARLADSPHLLQAEQDGSVDKPSASESTRGEGHPSIRRLLSPDEKSSRSLPSSRQAAGRRQNGTGLLLHIHDELVWQVPRQHVNAFGGMLREVMEDTAGLCGPFATLTVPMPVSIRVGTDWGHMESWQAPHQP